MTLRIACILVALVSPATFAQETNPAEPKSQPQPQSQPTTKPEQPKSEPAKQPSLDDLLGVEKDKKTTKPVEDPSRTELERQLTMKKVEEQFKQAVQLMDETAVRIKDGKDTGLATQRMQEDILRKLDMVITSAEQQQQRQQRQRQKQKQQQQRNQQDPSRQSQQNDPNQEHGKDAAPDTIDPPGRQDANLRPGTAARGTLWGSLPERVRNAISQGDADKYSAMYRKWTEAYYRKLAEEANK